MPNNQSLKLSLYQKQKNIVLYFLVLFCVINIVYAANYYWAIILSSFIIGLVFLSYNQFVKYKSQESGILVQLAMPILSMSFAQSVGDDAPIWMFHIVIIFQVLFLVENSKHQFALVALNIFSGMFISYLQDQPIPNVLSRGTVLGMFSIYGYNTIKSLLISAESLQSEIEGKIKLNIELFNTRAFQRQVLDSTNYAIIALNENNNIVEFNKGAEIMLGYSAADVLGKLDPIIFFDEIELKKRKVGLSKKYDANINFGIDTVLFLNKIGLPNTSEWTLKTIHGKAIIVQTTINNIKDDNGKIVGYSIVSIDITEKKQHEENLQTSETIIANGPSILIKWTPETNRKITYISNNVFKLLGYSTIEITKPDYDFNTLIHKKDLSNLLATIDSALLKKTNHFIVEYRIKNKQNEWIWMEESSFTRTNNNGETLWYEGILTDITTKKLTAEKLTRTENRYELAIKSTNAGVWEWNQNDQENVWWSDKVYEQLGYQVNEIIPTYSFFISILHPDDIDVFLETSNSINNAKQSYLVKYRLKTKDGLYKWFLSTGKPIIDEHGEVVQIVGSLIDIHDRNINIERVLEREMTLRAYLEKSANGIFHINMNDDFTYFNTASNLLLGYSVNQLENTKFTAVIAEDYVESTKTFLSAIPKDDTNFHFLTIPIKNATQTAVWVKLSIQATYNKTEHNGYMFEVEILPQDSLQA